MSTEQPKWKYSKNLGDVNAIDHGGLFLYVDETGAYPPELEKLDRTCAADDSNFEVSRVTLDRLKEVTTDEGTVYLVPFNYDATTYPHPLPQYEEWFVRDLASVAATMDTDVNTLRANLCSDDPERLAEAYRNIYDHHGWANGDSYPLTLNLDEVEDHYKQDEVSKREPMDRLEQALQAEHVNDCGDSNNTCDVSKAFDCGLFLYAAHLLAGATECPRTLSALASISPMDAQIDEERLDLLEEDHMDCSECNAIVWTEEDKAICGNCKATVQRRVKVENSDASDDETGPMVIVTMRGKGAAKWAKEKQQSLMGASWEADGDDFAYVIVSDAADLIEDIKSEVGSDVAVDDSEYSPPDAE